MSKPQQSAGADLAELRALVAIADAGSFTAAARRLGRDAAVVSRRLQALEARLGVRLVARTTRRTGLTEAGAAYLARIRPLLEALEAADTEIADAAGGEPSGHLRIAIPGSFGRLWIAPLIVEFLSLHAQISVEVDSSNRFVDLVGERFDIAIRLGTLADSRLIARRVARRRRLLCASPRYLRRAPALTRPADLRAHACLLSSEHDTPGSWRFERAGRRPEVVPVSGRLAGNDAELLVEGAVNGLGVLLTSDWYVGRELAEGRLVEVLPEWSLADAGGVFVVTSAPKGSPAKVRVFSDWIARKLARPPWERRRPAH